MEQDVSSLLDLFTSDPGGHDRLPDRFGQLRNGFRKLSGSRCVLERIDDQDPNGVYVTRQFIDVARRGNGFLYYIYPDPSRNMSQKLKLSYVADVDGTWFLGSGIYAKSQETER